MTVNEWMRVDGEEEDHDDDDDVQSSKCWS